MRYSEITSTPRHQRLAATIQRSTTARGTQTGFLTPEKAAALPHIVNVVTLSGDQWDPADPKKLRECQDWCQQQCQHSEVWTDPIRDQVRGHTGWRFHFADEGIAAQLKMFFD